MVCRYGSLFGTMEKLRKTWISGSGKGSQSDNYEEMIELANAIKEFAHDRLKEREEW